MATFFFTFLSERLHGVQTGPSLAEDVSLAVLCDSRSIFDLYVSSLRIAFIPRHALAVLEGRLVIYIVCAK